MVGQALQKMELNLSTQLHPSMVVAGYASGMGAEVSQRAIPFVHSVLGEFQNLDEGSEFIIGLELVLSGLDLVLSGLERLSWD